MLKVDHRRWFVNVELHIAVMRSTEGSYIGKRLEGPSEEMLRVARNRGLYTAVVVSDREYYGHDLDHLVDEWIVCNTRNEKEIAIRLKEKLAEIVAVTSLVDTFVGVAAGVARLLGLAGPSPLTEALSRNKALAREALDRYGLPNVRWSVEKAADVCRSPIGYPCVIKPIDGAASWDVVLASNDSEALYAAQAHLTRTYPRNVSPRHELVFEQFIEGPLFSVEGIVTSGGEAMIFGWSSRIMTQPPYFAELALTFSCKEPVDGANAFARSVLRALGYDFGPFHLEFILSGGKLWFVELNPRLMGAGSHNCITEVIGVSPIEMTVANLLGESVAWEPAEGVCTQMYFTPKEKGMLVAFANINDIGEVPGLVAAAITFAPGTVIESVTVKSSSDYIGWVIHRGANRREVEERAQEALDFMWERCAISN